MNNNIKVTALGPLPSDWSILEVEDVCEILDSKRKPLNKQQREAMAGDIPYYGANGIVDYVNDYLFDENLILMAEDGGYFNEYQTRPIAYKVLGKSWVNNHAHILKPKTGYSFNWIYYNLVHKNILSFINGGTRAKLNQAELRKLPIAIPPLKVQEKIAGILSTVDDAIDKTEEIIEQIENVKNGLMQQLLTKGIGHTKFKQTEIGEIPEGWDLKSVNEVTTVTRLAGYEYSELWETTPDGSIIALRGYNIGENEIIPRDTECITEELSQRLIRSKLFKGDIVFPCVGTIGKAAVIKEDNKYHINQNIAKITCNKERLYPDFLVQVLMSHVTKKQIIKFNTSSSQPNVLVGSLRKFLIPIPPLEEQKVIYHILGSIIEKRKAEKNKLEILNVIKKGLMQDLLTGKVRVKVDEIEVVTK